jgi:ubiquinone/menaquinone biosynthesis C-methylase UbiE
MCISFLGLKRQVHDYWNANPCNALFSKADKFARNYFEDIEQYRYNMEPYIWNFAQFSRYHGKRILEIGVGVGTDFIQWVRSGCIATGCDLTPAAVEYTRKRLEAYGLQAVVQQEDCENLSFPNESFDLVYSFGVLHHTPDIMKAISEIYRVLKPKGAAKVMLYNRYSWPVLRRWIDHALKKGKLFRSIDDIIYYYQESPGTKVFSIHQIPDLFRLFSKVDVYGQITPYDFMCPPKILPDRLNRLLIRALGNRFGWNLMITAIK